MKTASAKAKGRNLQKYVIERLLHHIVQLCPDDVTSRSMGAGGEDILFSPHARNILPISIECKSHKAYSVYKDYEQAIANSPPNTQPVLIIKQNKSKPLAIIDLEFLLELL